MSSSHDPAGATARQRALGYPTRGPRVGILRGVPAGGRTTVTHLARHMPAQVIDHEQAAAVRADAVQAGYEEGYTQGMAAAAADVEAHLSEVRAQAAASLSALTAAATDLRRRETTALGEVADQVAAMAVEIAEIVLRREVAAAADAGRDAIRRAIAFVPDGGAIEVRLHPQDAAALGAVEEVLPGRDVVVVPDPAVARGDAVVQVGQTRIDAQIATALDRVREVLR